ncbi:MAG: hypothetical protein J7501_01535 [Bdellovibrio sp.]|nr:hypothetical protein [Bdellovibrio sp.]
MSSHVFLTECSDFAQATVIKSYLMSQGLHPRVRDEKTRTVAPHLEQFLGKLIMEIPEDEFMAASEALENLQDTNPFRTVEESEQLQAKDQALLDSQALAKKCLINAVIGCIIVPVICNLYSMFLGFRVLGREMPLSRISRTRLILAMGFNALSFYIWLTFGFKAILHSL